MKKAKIIALSLMTALVISLLLSACSNLIDDETGTIIISIGSSTARDAWMPSGVTSMSQLDHTITIVDSTGQKQEKTNIKEGSSPVSFTVATGSCQITVKAYFGEILVAEGFANPIIKAGPNTAPIQMKPPLFSVNINMIDNVSGDSVTVTPATGNSGAIVTLNCTLANTADNNQINFSGIGSVIEPITATGTGTRLYTIDVADAIGSTITINAIFTHDNLISDPISFSTESETKTYGDASFTNTIETYSGIGAITYSSSDTSIATVDSASGQVTILKVGAVTITASKAADTTYASATATYSLVINAKAVNITPGNLSRTLIPIESTDNAYGKTATSIIMVSGLVGSDTITVSVGTNSYGLSGSKTGVTNGNNNSTNNLTLTYDGTTTVSDTTAQSVGLTISGNNNYTLLGSPTVSVAIIDGQAEARAIPVNSTNIAAFNEYANTYDGLVKHYKLYEDITLPTVASGSNWTPIGYEFTGTFDGQAHSISGLNIDVSSGSYIGLFSQIGTGGVVKNLAIKGTVKSTSTEESTNVGSMAGANRGTIENCSSSVAVTGPNITGGLVGNNFGTIKNCYTTGNVTSTKSPTGGIAGYNNTNSTNSAEITNCYSTSAITCNNWDYVGGIVGQNMAYIRNCVALNLSITANANTGTGTVVGRIVAYSSGTLSNNFAKRDMSVKNGNDVISITEATQTNVNGFNIENVTENWWKTESNWIAAQNWTWGNNASAPWKWNSPLQRPILWFE